MTTTYRTRQDLINQTLTDLGVLPVGQAPDADTYEVVNNLVDGLLAELEARDVIHIQDVDNGIEDRFFMPLSRIIAWRAAPAFGAGQDATLAMLATQGEDYLKEMDRLDFKYTGVHHRTMKTDYYPPCAPEILFTSS